MWSELLSPIAGPSGLNGILAKLGHTGQLSCSIREVADQRGLHRRFRNFSLKVQ